MGRALHNKQRAKMHYDNGGVVQERQRALDDAANYGSAPATTVTRAVPDAPQAATIGRTPVDPANADARDVRQTTGYKNTLVQADELNAAKKYPDGTAPVRFNKGGIVGVRKMGKC